MKVRLRLCVLIAVCALLCRVATAQDSDPAISGNCATSPCVTTYHNGIFRTGVNFKETILSATGAFPTITASQVPVDGMVYAQPLYLSAVPFNAGSCTSGSRNIVYVVTENNSVYAIDADTYTECTHVSLNSGDTAIPVPDLPIDSATGLPCDNLTGSSTHGSVGITSTPAIDPAHNVMFVVSAHRAGSRYTQRLTALDVRTLATLSSLDLPTIINGHKPSGYPTFYALNESQRSGLLLTATSTTANIAVAWASFCDSSIAAGGYFGLVAEFDYSYAGGFSTSQVEAFYPMGTNTSATPNAYGGAGIWMSGGAPAADAGGNVYVAVGNGIFEGVTSPLNYGESVVKLGGSSLAVEDFYTPNVWSELNQGTGTTKVSCIAPCKTQLTNGDWDLGSGGVVILSQSTATSAGELVAGGKEGMFYVPYYCQSSTACPLSNWNNVMGGLDGPR